MMGTCVSCRWWKRDRETVSMGTCHSSPPAIHLEDGVEVTFPAVQSDDFCPRYQRVDFLHEQQAGAGDDDQGA